MSNQSGQRIIPFSKTKVTKYVQPGLNAVHYYGAPWTTTSTTNIAVETMSRASVNTPYFRVPSKRPRQLPMNAFTYSLVKKAPWQVMSPIMTYKDTSYYYSTYDTYTGTMGDLVIDQQLLPSASRIQALQSELVAELRRQVKGQTVNTVVVAAEASKTFAMIGDTASLLASTFVDLKKGRFQSAASRLGLRLSKNRVRRFRKQHGKDPHLAAENAWLQLQFGWKPLLSDIYGAAEHLAKVQTDLVRTKVHVKKSITLSDTYVSNELLFGSWAWPIRRTRSSQYDISMTCHFADGGSALHQSSSLGLTNPASLAWELLPFSFVVDWFLPVGNYLDSLDATLGLGFQRGCQTTFIRTQGDLYANRSASGQVGEYYGSASASYETINVTRSVLTTFPSPVLPSFKNPFTMTHVVDSIALLKQAFSR